MNGQWIGLYEGSNSGQIVINVDELPKSYIGVAYLNESSSGMPPTAAFFDTGGKEKTFSFKADVLPVNRNTGMVDSWENVKSQYADDVVVPSYADVTGSWNDDTLCLNWKTNLGTTASVVVPKSQASKPSALVPSTMTWKQYKDYVGTLENSTFLFRGQNKPWRLRSSFHRTGRADLLRFLNEDIQLLHKHLSARTRHVFNLEKPNENGAFFNLVQHHGYPTPLLDWTYSPYVAAFFAYRGISNTDAARADGEKVRIHVFDQARWTKDFNWS